MAEDILSVTLPALSATSDVPAVETPTEPVPEAPADAPAAPETPPEIAPEPPPEPESPPGEAGETGEAPPVEQVAQPKPDSRTTRIQRLEALVERQSSEFREFMAWQREQAQARLQPPTPEPIAPPQPDPRPMPEQYQTPAEYEAALVQWSAKEALRAEATERAAREAEQKATQDRQAQDAQQAEAAKEIVTKWNERRAEAISRLPDYEIVAEADTLPVTQPMAGAIQVSDNGPDVAYHLGQNPQEAVRIANLPPARQIYEIGLLAGRIAAQAAAKPTTVPVPPAPITPVGNRSTAAEPSPDEMSGDAYFDRRIGHYRSERRPSGVGRVN